VVWVYISNADGIAQRMFTRVLTILAI